MLSVPWSLQDRTQLASLSRNTPYGGMKLPSQVIAKFLCARLTVLDESGASREAARARSLHSRL